LPGPHETQVEARWPHAVSMVAVTQVLPMQQPLQVVALQVEPPVHTPPAQDAPEPHVWQVTPLRPHAIAVCWPDGTQVLPLQQPAHEKKSHAVAEVHAPLLHERPFAQPEQVAPPVPHSADDWSLNATQRLPAQQPLGQLAALQVVVCTHWPFMHAAFAPQP
jgi:hypothetical protein